MKRFLCVLLSLLLCMSGLSALAESTGATLEKIDMSKWQYASDDDVYWQVGLSYAATPADENYETMGIFVPGAYFDATENGDGTYTCSVNAEGAVAGFTATTAPLIMPVNTPGYAAMAAPTGYTSSMGYGSISDYTGAGMIVIFAGARGRDAGAPAGVTDFKAAIRYTRYNADILPGDMDSIFSLGMSGGGAQSALIGATGDSDLYTPYLSAIGAVLTTSDAVKGSMCWCPITNLDLADEAYEWNMGNTRSGLSDEEQAYSDCMAVAFAEAINAMGLTDAQGNSLLLTQSEEGIYQSGTYYEYIKQVVETSLEHFLTDTTFPYTATSGMGGRGGRGGFGGGQMMGNFGGGQKPDGDFTGPDGKTLDGMPDGEFPGGDLDDMPNSTTEDAQATETTSYEEMDGITRTESASTALSLSGTYETAADYVDALNANGAWVTYDAETGKVSITSVSTFTAALKNASKSIAAFDQLDRGQGENTLFGYGDGNGAHFDAILASLVAGSSYEEDFTTDLAREDSVGNTVDVRLNMYTPLYYLLPSYEGYGTAQVADYWRIRTGINQGDTALCTEVNLALALDQYSETTAVDFETVWGQGHTEAERTGSSTENFITWVNACMRDVK